MKNTSIVMVFDASKGVFTEEQLFSLSPKKALIAFLEQRKSNYNTSSYPKDIEGVYKSSCYDSTGRILYDLDDTHTVYSQWQ